MKPIPGFPAYSITPEGKIFKGDREILRKDQWDGYPRVRLPTENGLKNFKIHKLVAATYLGHTGEVRHLDNDRSNVHLNNLAPGDRISNAKDRLERGSYHYKTKLIGGKSFIIAGNKLILPEKKLVFQIGTPLLEHQEDGVRYVSSEEEIEKLAWTSASNAKKHADKHADQMQLSKIEYVKQALDAKKKKLALIRQATDGSKRLRTPDGKILVLSNKNKIITYFDPNKS